MNEHYNLPAKIFTTYNADYIHLEVSKVFVHKVNFFTKDHTVLRDVIDVFGQPLYQPTYDSQYGLYFEINNEPEKCRFDFWHNNYYFKDKNDAVKFKLMFVNQ